MKLRVIPTILMILSVLLLGNWKNLEAKKKNNKKKDKVELFDVSTLGEYSETAPYNCPKTDKIITRLADELAKDHENFGGATKSGALGLLATGEKKYQEVVFAHIKKGLKDQPKGEFLENTNATGWLWGYELILLAEYYLLTQDEKALPAIKSYALSISKGQDAAGMWGHMMAREKKNRAPGYGQMNQPTLSNFVSLILAKKCGLSDPLLDEAIEKSRKYARHHAWEGCFPYGFHGPSNGGFNNNGTSGSAAIAFSLLGDQDAATFFSQCSAVSHKALGSGHASSFFNPLWTPLGAHLSGPEVYQEFHNKSQWFFKKGTEPTLEVGRKKEGASAGVHLLFRSAHRKALMITGRESEDSIHILGEKDVARVMGLGNKSGGKKSHEKLIHLLKDRFPQVRKTAIEDLRKFYKLPTGPKGRKKYEQNKEFYDTGRKDVHVQLLGVIQSGNSLLHERISAISYYEVEDMPKDIEEAMIKILRSPTEPMALRCKVVGPLGKRRDLYTEFMELMLEEKPHDPFGYEDIKIGRVLVVDRMAFREEMKKKNINLNEDLEEDPWLDKVIEDKDLYYQCVNRLLQHKRQVGRAVAIQMLRGVKFKDFHRIADSLEHVLKDEDKTYHSYHNPGLALGPGINLYTKFQIKEGLNHLESMITGRTGKWSFKFNAFSSAIPKYGSHGAETLERLIETNKTLSKAYEKPDGKVKKLLEKLKADENTPELISLNQAKAKSLELSQK